MDCLNIASLTCFCNLGCVYACLDPVGKWRRDEYCHPVVLIACLTFDPQETVQAKSTSNAQDLMRGTDFYAREIPPLLPKVVLEVHCICKQHFFPALPGLSDA